MALQIASLDILSSAKQLSAVPVLKLMVFSRTPSLFNAALTVFSQCSQVMPVILNVTFFMILVIKSLRKSLNNKDKKIYSLLFPENFWRNSNPAASSNSVPQHARCIHPKSEKPAVAVPVDVHAPQANGFETNNKTEVIIQVLV
jgi:hypothetical protein